MSARALLRAATGDLHTELDGLFADTDFESRTSYGAFVARQAAPLLVVEAALDGGGAASLLPDWPARRRSDAVLGDLHVLGQPAPAAPPCPVFESTDAAIGALYVLEGSRLGAKVLVRRARASSDATVRSATAFLSHGEGVPFWQSFLALLARREEAGLDETDLVEGARHAFAAFLVVARQDADGRI